MNLILISALIAVCGAAKLDRTYLPPSAESSGGSPGSLQAPLTRTSEQGLETPNAPTGSYTNDFGGVVVDAAAGTRSSESLSGLGGPRTSYGSSNSKVGDAAFRGSVAGFRGTQFGSTGQIGTEEDASRQFDSNGNSFQTNSQLDTHSAQGFPSIGQTGSQTGQFSNQGFQGFQDFDNKSERPQAARDRNSNILAQTNDVNADRYSYGFETDNGIAVGENGVDVNGIQAEGGYSYQGDDGQVYKVTYVADEKGYRPQGAHLPTPPPIPYEILKSLEQNAKEEATGLVDDGSYDAQKYNTESDYTHDNSGNIQHNGGQLPQFGKRPESASTFNNQNNQAFGTTGSTSFGPISQTQDFNGNIAGTVPNTFGTNQDQGKLAQFGNSGSQTSFNGQGSRVNSHSGSTPFSSGSQIHPTFGQSGQANQFNSNSGSAQHANFGQSSHSGQPLSGHQTTVSGQSFGQTGNQFSTSGQAQGAFGSQTQFGSQFSQQASASALFENKTPESGSQQSQQGFNTPFSSSSKPSSGHSQDASHTAHSQPAQSESGTSFKPQGSEAFSGASLNQNQDAQDFGKPFPQVFSGENFNRPSSGNFNSKPTFGQSHINKGSASGFNQNPQPSGHFMTQNEYLPPSNNNQPQLNKEASALTSNSGISNSGQDIKKEQTPVFVALNRPKPNFASASASTSFSQPTFQPQPARPLNVFDTQPKPNQFNQQTTQFTQQTNQPSSQTQAQFNTNSQQSGAFATQSAPDLGTKPTMVPDTELTTPLEPNENFASQSSQFPSQTTANFDSFASKPANQGQAQFGFQGNSAFGQSTSQTLSPSAPTPTSQFGAASPSLAFQSSVGKGPQTPNGNPQFSQNAFGQTQQNQPSSGQGIDNSYYYNPPSKAFGALAQRPQGTKFPSSSSYQSNGVATQNQFINKQSFQRPASSSLSPVGATSATQSIQTQGYKGITQAAISSFPSASQSQPSQIGMTQTTQFGSRPSFNQQSSSGNQAQFIGAQPSYNQQSNTGNRAQEKNQFGSVGTPVQSSENLPSYNQQSTFGNQAQVTGDQERFPPVSVGTFPSGEKPVSTGSQTKPQFGLPQISESSESSQQTTQTQQYQGTIYEYNKPAEVFPTTQTDSSSGQSIPESKPSFGQSQNTKQNTKPLSQGSETKFDAQGNKPFGSLASSFQFGQQAQSSQGNQISQSPGTQFASQPDKPFAQFGQTAQSLPIGSSAQQNNQGVQTTQSFKPFGSASLNNQSPFGSKTQFGSQSSQFGQNTQSFGNRQPSLPEKTASQPQLSSQNFQNFASSQDNGYFYPANPKTQFGQESKNQFNLNSQPGRPQTGITNQFNSVQGNPQSTSFNQQSQFNSASRPQFGAQNKNTQATFGQKIPNSPIQPIGQSQFGPSSASSQAFATGHATASASASTSNFEPFVSQDKTQISQAQPDTQDQSGQGTQAGVQSTKPFGTQESKEVGSKPFGSHPSGKPLFKSACCQASKDSTSAQSTDTSSSFPGAQSFNTQTLTGKGEQFGGPRQPPSFDEQTGYHY